MKLLNLFLFLLFGYFSAVQYNDPDAWIWMLYYGLVAVCAALAFFNKNYKPLLYFVLIAAIAWLVLLIPSFGKWLTSGMESISGSMKMEKPYIEEVREFLGVIITLAGILIILFQAKKKR